MDETKYVRDESIERPYHREAEETVKIQSLRLPFRHNSDSSPAIEIMRPKRTATRFASCQSTHHNLIM